MSSEPINLSGRTVVITGGARGIGLATAKALTAVGARVAIGDLDGEKVSQSAQEVGAGTVAGVLDVTQPDSFAEFLALAGRELGHIDVLINNAGIMPIGPFVEETDVTARRLIDINLHGVIFGSKLALERFLPRGRGHLVNIASSAGKAGFPGGATYCATKHAVVGLCEALRAETRGTGIELSCVMPVVVDTELGSGLPDARGFGTIQPEDVANEIVDALQFSRFDVYVPKSVGPVLRSQALFPRRFSEWVARWLKGDQILAQPDHGARAAYEARMAETMAAAERERETETV